MKTKDSYEQLNPSAESQIVLTESLQVNIQITYIYLFPTLDIHLKKAQNKTSYRI